MFAPGQRNPENNPEDGGSPAELDLSGLLPAGSKVPQSLKDALRAIAHEDKGKENIKIQDALRREGIEFPPSLVYRIEKLIKNFRKGMKSPPKTFSSGSAISPEAASKTKDLSPDKVRALRKNAYMGWDAAAYISRPFFGRDVRPRTIADVPQVLKKSKEVIESNGHSFSSIVDHILMLNTMPLASALPALLRLFPAVKGQAAEHKSAVHTALTELTKPLERNQCLDLVAESAEESAKLLSGFFTESVSRRSALGNLLGRKGNIFTYQPRLSVFPLLVNRSRKSQLSAVVSDIWSCEVLRTYAGICKHSAITVSHNINKDSGKSSQPVNFDTIHINAEGDFLNPAAKRKDIQSHIAGLKQGGYVVIEWPSSAAMRERFASKEMRAFIRDLLRQDTLVSELHLGRAVEEPVDGALGRIFVPASINDYDFLLLRKAKRSDSEKEIMKIKCDFDMIEALGALDVPENWRSFLAMAEAVTEKERFATFNSMLKFTGILQSFGLGKDVSKKIERLLADNAYEEIARILYSSQL